MSDLISFYTSLRDYIRDDEDFQEIADRRYYIYKTPSNLVYPYASSLQVTSDNWLTLGRTTEGENFPDFRIWCYNETGSSGVQDLVKLMSAIDSRLNFSKFEVEGWEVKSIRRENKTKPAIINTDEDDNIWGAFLEYQIRLQKEEVEKE